jgi:hypothetical protein
MYKKFSCSGCGLDDKHLYMEVSDTGFCISCSTITEFTTGKKVLKASQQNPWEDKSFHNWSKDELYLVLHLTGLLATASVKEGEVLFDINPYKEVLKWFGDKQFLENEFDEYCLELEDDIIKEIIQRMGEGDDVAFKIAKNLTHNEKENLINALMHFSGTIKGIKIKTAAGLIKIAERIETDFTGLTIFFSQNLGIPVQELIDAIGNTNLSYLKSYKINTEIADELENNIDNKREDSSEIYVNKEIVNTREINKMKYQLYRNQQLDDHKKDQQNEPDILVILLIMAGGIILWNLFG